jgi:hypothetical protein
VIIPASRRLLASTVVSACGVLGYVAASADSSPALTDEKSPAQQRAEKLEEDRRRVDHRWDEFRAEEIDESWSEQTAKAIATALRVQKLDQAPMAKSIECRSKTCMVVLRAADKDQLNSVIQSLAMRVSQVLPVISAGPYSEGIDGVSTILFLTK